MHSHVHALALYSGYKSEPSGYKVRRIIFPPPLSAVFFRQLGLAAFR